MYPTGIKKITVEENYQNKVEEVFPSVDVPADGNPDLKAKPYNSTFTVNAHVKVTGIEQRDAGGGENKTFYTLEIREIGVLDKPEEQMSSDELLSKIESN